MKLCVNSIIPNNWSFPPHTTQTPYLINIININPNDENNNYMFCSIIIPTVGRPSLSASVKSALEQNFTQGKFEIIVVNDSGQPLPPEKWQTSHQVQIITTQKRERCFARNTGATLAQGDYFCFLDDDDWLLPDALSHLWTLAQKQPQAAWLYGSAQFVDNTGKTLGTLNQGKSGDCFVEVMAETWIPIQASLIKAAAFFQAGGFDSDYIGTEDLNLLRHIAWKHHLAHTSEIVAGMRRGGERKTETEYAVGWYYIAQGRDALLTKQDILSKLLKSADGSAYLHGLVLRNYKSAMFFNLRNHHWLSAASRFLYGFVGCLKSFKYVFAKEYWLAAKDLRPLHLSLIENPSPDYASVEEWLYS